MYWLRILWAAVVSLAVSTCAVGQPKALDGLEMQNWAVEAPNWGNPATLERVDVEGRGKALRVTCQSGPQDKTLFSLSKPWDAQKRPFVVMDVRNDFKADVGVAVAVVTGKGFNYFESSLRKPHQGSDFTRVIYDLSQPNFKCQKYNWIQGIPIENLDQAQRLFILFFPQGTRAGVMLLDNIRLARGVFQAMKPPQAPFASGLPERELLGDFNNDGALDRLLVGPTLALERGNADGTFADATGGSGLPQTARAATWADVDRDGNLDAVLIVGQDYAVRVLLGDGTGRFTDATADWAMPTDAFPAPVVRVYAADDEPDGDVDLHFELADEKWVTWRHFSTHGPRDLSFVEVTMEGAHEGHITLNLSDGKGPPAGEARPYGGKSWGARRLIPALGEIPGPDARALYFLPPGQYQLSATLSTGKALTESILVEDPGQRVCIAPDALFALWPKRLVKIDGKMSPGEWDDAPKIAKTLSYVDYKTKKDESHPMTI
ncbi:MAG: VCBS repeat-containing protein, partial [Planctomycetes bacterium]|nr:VCBS repeat-containing protein [Planctomycetota bacterium]